MLVTLTTDFGTRDGYVAAMKAVMLRVSPLVRFLDVTHEIPAQDVMEAAFVIRQVIPYAPPGTIHLVVVDPTVGTERKAIAATFGVGNNEHTFVGPDNGLLPLIAQDSIHDIVELNRPDLWASHQLSATFHGRDVFGPVAAALAAHSSLSDVGTPLSRVTNMHWPLPRFDEEGTNGMVVHVDRFGNCITNIRSSDLERFGRGRRFKCYAGSAVIRTHALTYGETDAAEPLTLFGSTGHLEIAIHGGNAAELLSVDRGDPVTLVFEPVHSTKPVGIAE